MFLRKPQKIEGKLARTDITENPGKTQSWSTFKPTKTYRNNLEVDDVKVLRIIAGL